MIDKRLINDLRKKVILTAIVSKIEYKNKIPIKLFLRKIKKDDIMVINYLDIKFPLNINEKVKKNQKIQFNGYITPSILKNELKQEFVGIKIKNVSNVKVLNNQIT